MRFSFFRDGHVLVLSAAIVSAGLVAGAPPLLAQVPGTTRNPEATFEQCQAIKDNAARLNCYENSAAPSGNNHLPSEVGTWHLLRTPNPSGGPPAVSVMQSADISRSDVDLTGLMLRCGESSTEVLVVLIRYLRVGAHPKVTVGTGPTSMEFTGNVVAPGLLVLLPPQATSLALGPWQAIPEIALSVDDEGGKIGGVIPLTGLKGALQILESNCPAR